MNENEFELDGKVYVSTEDYEKMTPCHMQCALSEICKDIRCIPQERTDGRNVIFLEKQP